MDNCVPKSSVDKRACRTLELSSASNSLTSASFPSGKRATAPTWDSVNNRAHIFKPFCPLLLMPSLHHSVKSAACQKKQNTCWLPQFCLTNLCDKTRDTQGSC